MKLFKRFINNNTFIFKSGKVQQVTAQTDERSVRKIEDALMPMVIIAREHYQEIEREYPVPDKRDVQSIIDNEFQSLKMTRIESKDLTTSKVKIYSFDDVSAAFVEQQLCIYIPETLLSQFLQEQELTTVERLDQTLNMIRKGEMVFSSSGVGLFQNPHLFLAASGVGEATSTQELSEPQYFALMLEQLSSLKSPELLMILKGQVSHKRLLQRLHFPSLGIGVAASILIYWGALWGHLKWQDEYDTPDYSSDDVRAVIQEKQKLDANIALYKELNNAGNQSISGATIWQLVISLLEANVSVGSLLYAKEELKLGLAAVSATDAIKHIRGFPGVKDVIVDGEINNIQGRQSVRVLVYFEMGDNHE